MSRPLCSPPSSPPCWPAPSGSGSTFASGGRRRRVGPRSPPPARRSPSIPRRSRRYARRRHRASGPPGSPSRSPGSRPSQLQRHLHPGPGRRRADPRRDRHHGADGTPVVGGAGHGRETVLQPGRRRNHASTSARPTSAGSIITPICRLMRPALPKGSRSGAGKPIGRVGQTGNANPAGPASPFRDQPHAAGREMVRQGTADQPLSAACRERGQRLGAPAGSFPTLSPRARHEDQRRGHPSRQHHRI